MQQARYNKAVHTEELKNRERARLQTVLLTIAVSFVSVLLLAGKPWSNGGTAAALSFLHLAIFAAHIARWRDTGMARLLLFGLTLGIVELIADALCVRFTGTLDYRPAQSAMILLSPWWMPLAWMNLSAQIGYLGSRFIDRWGITRGALITAALGAVNIPFYEQMALYCHWWAYRNCQMIPHTQTPLYIVIAELCIGLALGPLARRALRGSWQDAIGAGAAVGAATIIGGLIGYGLIERIPRWLVAVVRLL